jgi:hypothetical protein
MTTVKRRRTTRPAPSSSSDLIPIRVFLMVRSTSTDADSLSPIPCFAPTSTAFSRPATCDQDRRSRSRQRSAKVPRSRFRFVIASTHWCNESDSSLTIHLVACLSSRTLAHRDVETNRNATSTAKHICDPGRRNACSRHTHGSDEILQG